MSNEPSEETSQQRAQNSVLATFALMMAILSVLVGVQVATSLSELWFFGYVVLGGLAVLLGVIARIDVHRNRLRGRKRATCAIILPVVTFLMLLGAVPYG